MKARKEEFDKLQEQRLDLLRENWEPFWELQRLENEYVAGEFNVRSGKRRGKPLTKRGRRLRVDRMVGLARQMEVTNIEDLRLCKLQGFRVDPIRL